MTSTPPGAPDAGPRTTREEARDLGRLRRTRRDSPEGRDIAGVAGGLARHLDIDPIIVRIGLVVLVFFGAAGLIVYAAGWLFIPEEDTDDSVIDLDARSRGFVLYIAAGVAFLALFGDLVSGVHPGPWIPIGIVVVIAVLVLNRRGRDDRPMWDPGAADDAATTAGDRRTPRPRSARRRGPVLFWFTLVLVAVVLGTLGIIDGATGTIPDPAYPAAALGAIGLMLVLGAFWGRAGGLILLGIIATLALVGSVATQEWPRHDLRVAPTSAAQLHSAYDLRAGELVVDLSRIRDLTALDGRHLRLEGRVGHIEVVVPPGLGVTGSANIDGPGQIDSFGTGRGGIHDALRIDHVIGDQPILTLDADLHVGEISVRSAS